MGIGGGFSPATVSRLGTSKDCVGLVEIYGPIHTSPSGSFMVPSSADAIIRRLKAYQKDERVKAVVLRVNSPGGTVGSCQEIVEAVKRVQAAGKKVVASFGEVSASGGYYVSCGADRIVANPGTLTGSIGVILEFSNLEGLFRKIGVRMETIKSGAHKDIGSFSRAPTPEERKILQGLIDDAYGQFVRAIAEGRRMPEDKVLALADGRIYTGTQAKEAGLVDELGDLHAAILLAGKLAGIAGEPKVLEEVEPWRKLLNLVADRVEDSSLSRLGWAPVSRLPGNPLVRFAYLLQ